MKKFFVMKKGITFVIVTWNNRDIIENCLDSIYSFCDNFKVIIVDNQSSDGIEKLKLEKEYKDLKFYQSKENLGFAKGNNLALEWVDTEYVCFLNPDTVLLEDIVKPSIDVLKNKKDVGIVGCKLLNADRSLQASTFNFLTVSDIVFTNYRIPVLFPNFIKEQKFPSFSKAKKNKYVDWMIGAELIAATKDIKKIGGFSAEYYMYTEDMDLCKKMKEELGKSCYFISDVSLIHLGGASEAKNNNYNKMKILLRNGLMYAKKFHGTSYQKRVYRAFEKTYRVRLVILKTVLFGKENSTTKKMKAGLNFCHELKSDIGRTL